MDRERQKREILLRLKRIEGQVRGLRRMVEQGVPCSEIMTQVAAVTAALKKVGTIVVQTYMQECLGKAHGEPPSKRSKALRDFQSALSRYMDWA